MKNILVIGDWIVDQHWVTGIHRSPMSSRTGQEHYRSLQTPSGSIESLCGAGQVATILHRAKDESDKPLFNIAGIGIWHKDDTVALSAMLEPSNLKGQTPHRVTRVDDNVPPNIKLFNLGEMVTNATCGTTKVIRIYQHTGIRIDLIQRIDWEQRPPSRQSSWIESPEILVNSKLEKHLKENSLDAIVIKDNNKGLVTRVLINWLVATIKKNPNYEKIEWFISTKMWKADWINEISDVNIRLLLIPQIAARSMILNGDLNFWITNSGFASKKAIDILDDVAKKFRNKPAIVVLPNGLSVLACDFNESNRKGILQIINEPTTLAVGVPMASVFFPTLITQLITLRNKKRSFQEILKQTLDFTEKWRSFEVKLVENPENWSPDKRPYVKLGSDYNSPGTWDSFAWNSARKEWDAVFSEYGIIEKDGGKRIELWRSMTEIEGYICCVKSKRMVLQRLLQEFQPIRNKKIRQTKSCILIASPGSGKTFLVRCLAKSLRLRYLPFNITQMLSKNDILDCFDTIVTTQAQNPDEMLLVFFDEINAMVGGQHVYDVFLAPLEEGVYNRAGKTFHIDPCVWIFAGTARPKLADEKSTKGSDFEDRLTIREPMNLKIENPKADEARVEKVYLGVSLLQSEFPDVRMVSEKVLQTLHMLPGDLEIRRVKHIMKMCKNIQYGEVWGRNFDSNVLVECGIDEITWKNRPEGDLVQIVSRRS